MDSLKVIGEKPEKRALLCYKSLTFSCFSHFGGVYFKFTALSLDMQVQAPKVIIVKLI
jgi:hypothetical protein